jgi:hypothetical protein
MPFNTNRFNESETFIPVRMFHTLHSDRQQRRRVLLSTVPIVIVFISSIFSATAAQQAPPSASLGTWSTAALSAARSALAATSLPNLGVAIIAGGDGKALDFFQRLYLLTFPDYTFNTQFHALPRNSCVLRCRGLSQFHCGNEEHCGSEPSAKRYIGHFASKSRSCDLRRRLGYVL